MASAHVTRRFIGAKGVQLAADVGGDPQAPTIVLLHGGGQTRHSWGGAVRQLVLRGYHVINLDARGHGDSQWAEDGDYTLEVLAKDLECVIATLRSRPALVGASMGGATALLVAGAHADPLAAALVLVDVVPRIDTAGAAKIRSFMSSGAAGFGTLEEASDAVAAYNPHRPRPKSNAGLMKNLRLRGDGRLYWHWDPRVLQQVRHAEPPLFADRLNSAAERVHIPTLLVRGLQSDIVTEAAVADFRARLPQLEVFDVSGAGHMVAGDKNDVFNQGVFEFMQRHLPPDAAAP
ncbi:MAG TPA: alpha/beta hydrolase [Steroidobacteraceae bacterium]|nr:alpha/beta hydrolase [Steroidobacteraceae bacterium]